MLNTKTLKWLLIITSICFVPIVLIAIKSGGALIQDKKNIFLTNLLKQRDKVATVLLQDHNRTLTLHKENNTWQVVERNNYPILTDKVEDLLFSLADLRIVEPKTSKSELYEQLDVNDINESNSKSILISLLDDKNEVISKLYVGKREGLNLGEQYQEHIFIRRANEDQTWLVQGSLPLSIDFKDWVEQPLLGLIDSEQIKRIEVSNPAAAKVVVFKEKPEQEDFVLEASAYKPGMTLDLDSINTLPFEIAELEFDDLMLGETSNLDWSNSITATLETFPGIKLSLNVIRKDSKVFAKVHADAAQDASENIVNAVQAYNKSKEQWVFEIPTEFYSTVSVAKNDFLKPE